MSDKIPSKSVQEYNKRAKASFSESYSGGASNDEGLLNNDFTHNPLLGINLSESEKEILSIQNEISYLISKNHSNKYESTTVENKNEKIKKIIDNETNNKKIKKHSSFEDKIKKEDHEYFLWAKDLIIELNNLNKLDIIQKKKYEALIQNAIKGRQKIHEKYSKYLNKKNISIQEKEKIKSKIKEEELLFIKNRSAYYDTLEILKETDLDPKTNIEIKKSTLKAKQLESWLKWNLENKDYVSFEEFGSTMSYLSRQSEKAINATQAFFIDKYSKYIKFW